MGLEIAAIAAAFFPLLLLELPDKTFIATLVLSTRFRPLYAWIGAGSAFGVQCLVAVVAGGLLAQLPRTPVLLGATLLFAVAAILLWRGAGDEEAGSVRVTDSAQVADSVEVTDAEVTDSVQVSDSGQASDSALVAGSVQSPSDDESGTSALRAIATSFVIVFLAEWGDLSQLFIAGLAAKFNAPLSVFIGAWAALLLVSGLAALVGRALVARLQLKLIRRLGAAACAILAVLTLVELLG